ncbi:hypothetical protein KIW84_074186 [Lathyrus oleraceus]|uniref:Uncharacterized protein n=1 Tax=Pisum sativum TaxID=3888 RepID=A0A9D4VQM9_PEA|nr:hypothetical protein KIW84_074186 [Pisum sativum]
MKYLGEASVTLDIKITRSEQGISLDQSHYVEKILKKYNYFDHDFKATSGYVFNIARGVVTWKSKKRAILAQSTMESEMIALAIASEEANWLRCLLAEIPLWEKPMSIVLIHCDNTTAIAKIENRYYNGKKRQIRRKHNTVRDCISKGVVRVDHVCTDKNFADPLTKGFSREKCLLMHNLRNI